MRINHNIAALNTYRQFNNANNAQGKSMEKLSSGLRINSAADDAAGLAISEKMRGQIRGLDMAAKNSQDGISLIQTAEGALNETHDILQRMKELATQAANGTNTDSDRSEIQKEMNQLTSEVNRIGNTTEFNTQKLLDGGAGANKTALGSNEATGTAARGAVLQSVNPDAVKAGSFALSAGDVGLKINGATFSLDGTGGATYNADAIAMADGTAEGLKAALENLKTDELGVKLSEFADVNVTENGVVTITAKGTGDASNISIVVPTTGAAATAAEGATLQTQLGLPATMDFDAGDTITGTDGTAAVVKGNEVDLSKLTADNLQGKKFDLELNGEKTTITLDDSAVAAGSIVGTNPTKTELAAILNAAITAQVGANKVTVSTDAASDKLIFTQDNATIQKDGSTPSLKISGDLASTLLGGVTDGKNAVGGTFTAKFQIGASNGQTFQMDVQDMRAQALHISGTTSGGSHEDVAGAKFTATTDVTNGTNNEATEYALDVSSNESATAAIEVLDNAIQSVSAQRSQLGAFQNRLEHTINNLSTSSENLTAAESRIRDVDMAKEMMNQTKNSILGQAAQAMLAQSNQLPQGVLQLLR
ncbi:flagellin [Priestia megaterium]|uniref:flagellin N-terminal helical domain-containing protein n=1 Tax=Priestia megaterium TaxID=1404 RepID=UPI003457AB06